MDFPSRLYKLKVHFPGLSLVSIFSITKPLKNTTGREIDPNPWKSTLLQTSKSLW